MQLRKYIVSFLICGGIFGLSGCDGLFRDAPYNKLSQETIWGSQLLLDEYVLPWYRNMSNGFSIYMPTSSSLLKGACRDYLPWYGDQITISRADWYNTAYGDILKSISSEITRPGWCIRTVRRRRHPADPGYGSGLLMPADRSALRRSVGSW